MYLHNRNLRSCLFAISARHVHTNLPQFFSHPDRLPLNHPPSRCITYTTHIWICALTQLRADKHKCHGYLGSRALTFAKVHWPPGLHGPLLTHSVSKPTSRRHLDSTQQHTSLTICDVLFMVSPSVGKLPLKPKEAKMRRIAQMVDLHLGVENESIRRGVSAGSERDGTIRFLLAPTKIICEEILILFVC